MDLFPVNEISARVLRTDKQADLFTVYNKDGRNIFVLPHNLRDFARNILMISIIKAAEAKGYELETSLTLEMPQNVLKTDESDFVAGYVFQAIQPELGNYLSGTTKFAKGQRAYQRSCIDRYHSKARHLVRGGDKQLEERFGKMNSFTQAYWSVRTRLVSLLKSLPKKQPATLVSYLKSRQELEKLIHTQVTWHNRGVFREEEITYLDHRNKTALSDLQSFRDLLSNPTERLSAHFEDEYAPVRKGLSDAESEVSSIISRRSALLFIPGKKKRDLEFNQRRLLDKLSTFTKQSEMALFMPNTLPGISLLVTTVNSMSPLSDELLERTYSVGEQTQAVDVCTSWNAYLAQIVREDDD